MLLERNFTPGICILCNGIFPVKIALIDSHAVVVRRQENHGVTAGMRTAHLDKVTGATLCKKIAKIGVAQIGEGANC